MASQPLCNIISLSLPLSRSFLQQSATYLQNCNVNIELDSPAKSEHINEIESPLNKPSNGCLGLHYYWILAACWLNEERRTLFLAGFFHADLHWPLNHKNHARKPWRRKFAEDFLRPWKLAWYLSIPSSNGAKSGGAISKHSLIRGSPQTRHHHLSPKFAKNQLHHHQTKIIRRIQTRILLLPKLGSTFFVISPILSDNAGTSVDDSNPNATTSTFNANCNNNTQPSCTMASFPPMSHPCLS